MEMLYELVIDGENEKLVATDESLDVGDAVVLDNEVWLVLREAERAAVGGHARYLCRRAVFTDVVAALGALGALATAVAVFVVFLELRTAKENTRTSFE